MFLINQHFRNKFYVFLIPNRNEKSIIPVKIQQKNFFMLLWIEIAIKPEINVFI